MKLLRWMTTLVAAALLLAACGGGADRTKANLRLVNASSGYSQLDLVVDGSARQGQVGYGTRADYVEIDPSKTDTTVNRSGSSTPLLSLTPSVSKNRYYTLLAFGSAGALRQALLDDNQGTPDANRSLLRVVNAASDSGSLDVYLTGSDEALATSVAVQSAAAVGSINSSITVTSTSWRLRVTAAGSKTDVRLDTTLVLSSRQIATLVLTTGGGGVLINALVLDQQGGIGSSANASARVRVAAGVSNGALVAVTAGSANVLAATAAPVISGYVSVAAGAAVSVTVNGTAVLPNALTTVAGADYTLLVWGASSAPQATWIVDDNRAPADASQALLRLVNGVAGVAPSLSLTVDLAPVAGAVPPGSASALATVTPSSAASLIVTPSGSSTALFTATDQVLAAGGTYTLFVLGAPNTAGTVTGVLRKDR